MSPPQNSTGQLVQSIQSLNDGLKEVKDAVQNIDGKATRIERAMVGDLEQRGLVRRVEDLEKSNKDELASAERSRARRDRVVMAALGSSLVALIVSIGKGLWELIQRAASDNVG